MMDYDEDELEDLRWEDACERRVALRLSKNPDCRDPDHPGCERCIDDEGDEEE